MPIAVPPVIVDGFVPVVDLSAASGSSAKAAAERVLA
jgi:hypothetical protein